MTDKMPDVIYVLTDDDGDYLAFSEHDALAKKYICQDSINAPDGLDLALEWAKYRTVISDWDVSIEKQHFEQLKQAARELQRIKGLK